MLEMFLRQPGFRYCVCGPFTKNRNRIHKLKERGVLQYIYETEIGKACFQQDMEYGNFKDLPKKTASEKILCNRAFNIAKKLKYNVYKEDLPWWLINVLVKGCLLSVQGQRL